MYPDEEYIKMGKLWAELVHEVIREIGLGNRYLVYKLEVGSDRTANLGLLKIQLVDALKEYTK